MVAARAVKSASHEGIGTGLPFDLNPHDGS